MVHMRGRSSSKKYSAADLGVHHLFASAQLSLEGPKDMVNHAQRIGCMSVRKYIKMHLLVLSS